MKTFRIVTGDGMFEVEGDSVAYEMNEEGNLGVAIIYDPNLSLIAIIPGDVLVYIVDISNEFNAKMEPEPMNKECGCECQHD